MRPRSTSRSGVAGTLEDYGPGVLRVYVCPCCRRTNHVLNEALPTAAFGPCAWCGRMLKIVGSRAEEATGERR